MAGERLTDEELTALVDAALCVECGPRRTTDEDGCCRTCGGGAVGRWQLERLPALVAELRERRAQDLTEFECIVLATHLKQLHSDPLADRAVTNVILKLLGAAKGEHK